MADRPDFTPNPEEAARIASHFGPEGPVAAVYGWLGLVEVGDFAGAWASMDDNLRLSPQEARPGIACHGAGTGP